MIIAGTCAWANIFAFMADAGIVNRVESSIEPSLLKVSCRACYKELKMYVSI